MKKNLRKVLSFVLALVMVLGVAAPAVPVRADEAASIADLPASIDGLSIAYPYNTEFIQQTGTSASRFAALTFESARGEVESAQMILTPKFDVTSFKLTMNNLQNANGNVISAQAFEVYIQHYVTYTGSKNGSDLENGIYNPQGNAAGVDGTFPDALIPQDAAIAKGENTISAGNNQGIWVNLNVGNAAPGLYTGTAVLSVNGEDMQIPVSVHIYDVMLPEEVHTKTSFGIWWDMLEEAEGSLHRAKADTYVDYLVSKRVMPCDIWNMTKWDDAFADYAATYLAVNPAISAYSLHYQKTDSGDLDVDALRATLTTLINKNIELAQLGSNVDLFQKAYFYFGTICDEPGNNSEYASVNSITSSLDAVKAQLAPMLADYPAIQESFLNVKHLVTASNPNDSTYDQMCFDPGNTALVGDSYVYCPQFQYLNTDAQWELYEGEEELWWYGCCHPCEPYPTYHINSPLVAARAVSWMMYDYGIDGNLYWCVNYWYDYTDSGMSARDIWNGAEDSATPGDGVLIMPGSAYGVNGPIGTIRLENIREGNEDYEYLWLLEQFTGSGDISAYTANMYNGVIASTDPAIHHNNRIALLAKLEELNVAQNGATQISPNASELPVDVLEVGTTTYYFEQNQVTNNSESAWRLLNATVDNWHYTEIKLDKAYSPAHLQLVADVMVTGVESTRFEVSYINGQWNGAQTTIVGNQWNTVTFDIEAICNAMGITQMSAFSFGIELAADAQNPAVYIDNVYLVCKHEYESVVTPPTADAQGYTTHTCTLCGDSYVDSYTDSVMQEDPGDLLANAVMEWGAYHNAERGGIDGYTHDNNCTDTVSGNNSSRSWKFTVEAGKGGSWGKAQFKLANTVDMSGKRLAFDIKLNNVYHWMDVRLKDSNWTEIGYWCNDIQNTTQWQTVIIDPAALTGSGDASNLFLIEFGVNDDTNKSLEQTFYIDNLRIINATEQTEQDTDLLANAVMEWGAYHDANHGGIDGYSYNNNSTTVVNENKSLRSWMFTVEAGKGGSWGKAQLKLANTVDLTGKMLAFDIKIHNVHHWMDVKLQDSSWAQIGYWCGDIQNTTEWQTVTIDPAALTGTGDASKLFLIEFGVNDDTNKSLEQTFYIDNLRLVCRTHQYESVVTHPTENTQGYTTHTCVVCGDCYVDNYTDYDLLKNATLEYGAYKDQEGYSCDPYCADTVSGDSKHSWKFTVDAGVGGWAKAQIKLAQVMDLTGKRLVFDIKLDNVHPWIDVKLHNSSWADNGYWCGNIQDTTQWQTVVIDPAYLEGCDPSDVLLLTFGADTDKHKDQAQAFYIDNLRIVDPAACMHSYATVVTAPNFTQGGYTTHTCLICGDSYVTDETPALTAEVSKWNIALGDDISATFYLNLDNRIENASAAITVDGKVTSAELIKQEDGTYKVSANVAAPQMTEDIIIQVIYSNAVSEPMTYTIRQYAEYILTGNYNDNTKALVKAMLNYGAAAQTYFGYNTNALANADYEITDVLEIPAVDSSNMVSGSASGIRFYGASVVFESKVAVRFYFTVTGDIHDYTFSTGSEPVAKNGMYYIEVAGINPQDYANAIELTVNGTLTVRYSPLIYISRMHSNSANENLVNLVAAMYRYYLAAKAM